MWEKCMKKVWGITVIGTVLLVMVTLGITLCNEKKYIDNTIQMDKIDIIGNYIIEDEEKNYSLPNEGKLDLKGHNKVIIEGHFNKEIPINKQLIMRIDNMQVKIFVNGNEIYSFGEPGTFVSYARSAGNLWQSMVSPGIYPVDEVRIELYNVYTDHVETTFLRFLDNLYVGYEGAWISNRIGNRGFNRFIAMFIICLGSISVGLACIMMRMKKPITKLACFGGLCISSGIWLFLDFDVQNYIFPYPVLNNSLDILSLLFSMFFLITYFALYLERKGKLILLSLSGTILGAILITTILQFQGTRDYYDFLFMIQSTCIIYTPIVVGTIFYEKRSKTNKEINKLLLPTIILAVGIMGDAICNMLDIIPYMLWFRVSYVIFMIIQFISITKMIRSAILESARIQVLEEIAYQDGLTGAGNRTAYLKKIENLQTSLRLGVLINVIVFDINNLKIINDTLGHEQGDEMIRRGAKTLLKVFGQENVYRIGGDEFVVILKDRDQSDCLKLIEQFKDSLQNNNHCHLDQEPISIAYGIASYDASNDQCYGDVFARADKNMYINKNKTKQKNTNVFYGLGQDKKKVQHI